MSLRELYDFDQGRKAYQPIATGSHKPMVKFWEHTKVLNSNKIHQFRKLDQSNMVILPHSHIII